MEPVAKARAQAPWKVCGARQGPFWGVSTLQEGVQSRVLQQVAWVEVGGLAPWRDACSGSNTARPVPTVTTCKERTGEELSRGDSASLPRAVWHRELPPKKHPCPYFWRVVL